MRGTRVTEGEKEQCSAVRTQSSSAFSIDFFHGNTPWPCYWYDYAYIDVEKGPYQLTGFQNSKSFVAMPEVGSILSSWNFTRDNIGKYSRKSCFLYGSVALINCGSIIIPFWFIWHAIYFYGCVWKCHSKVQETNKCICCQKLSNSCNRNCCSLRPSSPKRRVVWSIFPCDLKFNFCCWKARHIAQINMILATCV